VISRLKPGCNILINTSGRPQIDQPALLTALYSGRVLRPAP
jgi:phosphoglycerate dehydrogenase-like enzyme